MGMIYAAWFSHPSREWSVFRDDVHSDDNLSTVEDHAFILFSDRWMVGEASAKNFFCEISIFLGNGSSGDNGLAMALKARGTALADGIVNVDISFSQVIWRYGNG